MMEVKGEDNKLHSFTAADESLQKQVLYVNSAASHTNTHLQVNAMMNTFGCVYFNPRSKIKHGS